MSLAYENRGFSDYPQSTIMEDPSQDHHSMHQQRYPSPAPGPSDNLYNQHIDSALDMQIPELQGQDERQQQIKECSPPSPGRSRSIPRPVREVTKGEDGRFICLWAGCTEEIRSFNRKCEWSKHMDKHDRPYKCPADGCEKLPGFTYSGGLLRHEREVHNMHGGPRKQLNCPHENCKRHSGKGFSRQENLNEHLRRVHTSPDGEVINPDETDDEGSERAMKRKRTGRDDGADMQQNMARLTHENQELRQQVEMQSGQIAELVRQLQDVQGILGSRIPSQAPQAIM